MKDKIKTIDEVRQIREEARKEGKVVAFTNGCFDLLHSGHVDYLETAKGEADVLIVGVNDDASVRRIKGPKRPLIPLEDRAAVLAGLEAVDLVVAFSEDTPELIIHQIVPDVLAKGADWAEENIVGADLVKSEGGLIMRVPLREGRSTSSIIDVIVQRYTKED